jgi:2-iminobutanoate/2-iminopropanoate deaminase
MRVRYTNAADLAKPRAPYSHLAKAPGGLVAVAGQVAMDRDGNLVGGDDCGRQAEQVLDNLRVALAEVGLSPRDVIQLTTYLTRPEDIPDFFAARERIFANFFPYGAYPPNAFVVVRQLVRPELLVEIQAFAVGPSDEGGGASCSW